jgi:hypothetical protein
MHLQVIKFFNAFLVLQSTYTLLTCTSVCNYLESIDILGLLVAAIAHDGDHTGLTNAFEIASSSKLAIRYHDTSVSEYN